MLGPAPVEKEVLPELVLLLTEPLVVDAGFLRSAYEAVLGLSLEGGTEFVTGTFPFFMFQSAGILMSVSLGDDQYGDAELHSAFPHHDLRAVQSSLGFLARRRLAKHRGWIGACLLREQQPSGLDPYVHVGRALCPFALPGAAVGLIAPAIAQAVLFSPEHAQLLRSGSVRQIFSLPK
jgi:hypothetical protein